MLKILFITGSLNQTQQMHQIAEELPEFDCWFSQLFSDSPFVNFLIRNTTLLDGTILAGQFRKNSEQYLRKHYLQIDYGARLNKYDLVVYCSDLIVPRRMRQTKTIWVQEGMVDRYTLLSRVVKALHLPPSLPGNTSLNGASNICDIYCAASEGYKQYFSKRGTDANRIMVTGMPNYDNLQQYEVNDFPYEGYVMVATTDMRETFRYENRPAFIKKAVEIANGRQLLFKLHPNENVERATREIKKYAPADTLIFHQGNTNAMIANCCELITQYSTVVYTGMALGKKVHSWFDVDELDKLTPLQNEGTSAKNIAHICRSFLNSGMDRDTFLSSFNYEPLYALHYEEVMF
ncbi:hypothetical protein MUY27_17365 [Mucilaginibacter sp. RS28]|uniref:Uncharacterized protein n=1 Tax=Mucilaginibacter straminoryzae TaxID=2932774 RepID=A0A9X1X5F0_9SPHI|nr:hypothetical protein [Mucilaginibacter straminoryzae]MCJ8211492.1 hypothetical protein [Mucilaginibacter straminoryzae]